MIRRSLQVRVATAPCFQHLPSSRWLPLTRRRTTLLWLPDKRSFTSRYFQNFSATSALLSGCRKSATCFWRTPIISWTTTLTNWSKEPGMRPHLLRSIRWTCTCAPIAASSIARQATWPDTVKRTGVPPANASPVSALTATRNTSQCQPTVCTFALTTRDAPVHTAASDSAGRGFCRDTSEPILARSHSGVHSVPRHSQISRTCAPTYRRTRPRNRTSAAAAEKPSPLRAICTNTRSRPVCVRLASTTDCTSAATDRSADCDPTLAILDSFRTSMMMLTAIRHAWVI